MGFVGKVPAEAALTSDDITDGAIVNADINASAAIAMSKTAFSAGTGVTLSTNTLNVDAAQTGITSLLATDIKIGEDDQTKIDFEDANKINFYANNAKEVELAENSLSPGTSDGTALGTTSLMWSDLFLASGSVINFNNGDVTLTHSGNTLTVAGGTLATATITASTSIDITGSTGLILENDETITNSTNGTVLINGIVAGGTGSGAGVFQSNGDHDVTLQTGNSTTGTITITDGANGDVAIAPNGTGKLTSTGDIDVFRDANDADVALRLGTAAAESLTIQVLNGGSNKTAEEVHFSSATASATGDHGKMVFDVDGTDILTIDDGGLVIKTTGTIGPVGDEDLLTLTASGSIVTVAGELSVTTLDIGGTNVTATAAELNLLDGGTSVGGSITLADADGVVVNDGGTMKTIPASDIKTYASGGGTFDAVAGGAISAGDLVGIQADGKVKTLAAGDHNDASSDAPPNTQSQLLGDVGAAVAGISISYNPDTSKALLMWSEGNSEWSLNGAMVTINTTTGALTVGSAVEFFSGDNGSGSDGYPHWNAGLYPTATYDTNVDRYFVTYGMNGNAYNHTGLKGFVCYNNTGTSISSGSHSFIREHGYVYGAGNYYVTAMGAENKMAVTYFHRAWGSGGSEDTSTSGNRGYHTHLITVAASSFTITLSYKHMNTHVEGNSGITWDEGVDRLVQTFNGSDGDAHVRVGQWDSSAGEITFGTATEYNTVVGSSDGSGHFAMPYYWAAAGKVAIVQSVTSTTDASDTAQGLYLILATVTGGSTNTVAVSSNRTLLYNARLSSTEVCIYEFTAGNLDDKLIVTWKRGYTSNEAGWQIFDYVASGVTVSSFYGPVQMDDILDTYYHAPQVLSRGQGLSLLVIPDDDNDDIDYITPSMATQTSDAAHYTRWCGIANAAISSGATGTITSVGGVGTGQSSLTAGTWYQINSSGALAALTNSYTDNDYATVGCATSATTIYITGAFSN